MVFSSRVVREIVFVSVNCGCMCKLRSSSHHLVALPRLMSPCSNERSVFVQRPSWCSAIIPACFQDVLLCPRIHDRITTAGNKSSASWVARTSFVNPWLQFVF